MSRLQPLPRMTRSVVLLATAVALTLLALSCAVEGYEPTPVRTPENLKFVGLPVETSTAPVQEIPAPDLVIRGLARVDVTGNLDKRDFDCSGPHHLVGVESWTCDSKGAGLSLLYHVDVQGVSTTRISYVIAAVTHIDAADATAAAFLGFVATIPYDDADPAAARAWVRENIGNNGATLTIGSARFRLTRADTGMYHSLVIEAAGLQP